MTQHHDDDAGSYSQRPFTLPPGATEIVFVRHGASANATPGTSFPMVAGRGDPPLAQAGQAQARSVGERLRHEPLTKLFVTPLQRTHETAAPLAAATGLEPIVIDELIEVSLGEWEGGEFRIRAAQGDPVVWEALRAERWDVIPGAESPESVEERVRAGVARIVAEAGPDVSVASVVHGGIIGELCRIATKSRPFAFVHADNGSITRLVILDGGHWLLRSFNDISHLTVPTGPAA